MPKVESMLELVKKHFSQTLSQTIKNKKIKMIDIGSGDGRIVAAFAKNGFEAEGIEINPLLVLKSRWKLRQKGLSNKAQIRFNDFWHLHFVDYDIVTVYGITHMMPKLETKLNQELKPGSIIISNHFVFPHWQVKDKIGDVLLYEKD